MQAGAAPQEPLMEILGLRDRRIKTISGAGDARIQDDCEKRRSRGRAGNGFAGSTRRIRRASLRIPRFHFQNLARGVPLAAAIKRPLCDWKQSTCPLWRFIL